MRSEIQPEASRLTTPIPSISDSISAPRAAPKPRSPQYATMCTWGMDIATQQETPATHSSACTMPGAMPIGRSPACACPGVAAAAGTRTCSGGRGRSTRASGSITATQNTPMPI